MIVQDRKPRDGHREDFSKFLEPMFDPAFPVVHPFPEQEGPSHAARHTVIPAGHGGRVPRTGFAILETVDQPLGPLLELRDQRKGTP